MTYPATWKNLNDLWQKQMSLAPAQATSESSIARTPDEGELVIVAVQPCQPCQDCCQPCKESCGDGLCTQ